MICKTYMTFDSDRSVEDHLSWRLLDEEDVWLSHPLGPAASFSERLGPLGCIFGSLELSWRVLGESRGPLGGVLGRPGAISVKTFRL